MPTVPVCFFCFIFVLAPFFFLLSAITLLYFFPFACGSKLFFEAFAERGESLCPGGAANRVSSSGASASAAAASGSTSISPPKSGVSPPKSPPKSPPRSPPKSPPRSPPKSPPDSAASATAARSASNFLS